jgi:hypothetical protein
VFAHERVVNQLLGLDVRKAVRLSGIDLGEHRLERALASVNTGVQHVLELGLERLGVAPGDGEELAAQGEVVAHERAVAGHEAEGEGLVVGIAARDPERRLEAGSRFMSLPTVDLSTSYARK